MRKLSGVYAALITPVDERGRPHAGRLHSLMDFVIGTGVNGLCIGGGTSEYPHFDLEDRKRVIAEVAEHVGGAIPFMVAIGAPTPRGVLEVGEYALGKGSSLLLLPMPYFYRYEQEDLAAYARHVVRQLGAPCMLYNLAAFTNPLQASTMLGLLTEEPNLVGLKDSSGDRGVLASLSEGRSGGDFTLMCGSDGLFLDAMKAGWDGAISGIASCCPEVLVALYRNYRAGRAAEARRCQDLVDMLVEFTGRLPFPWSIRLAAEVRGFSNGPLPFPLSDSRNAQMATLREEFERWFDEHISELAATVNWGNDA